MSSWIDRLFGGHSEAARSGAPSDTDTVRRIVARLEELEPTRARFVASFAFVLARVANADLEISPAEVAGMERIVMQFGDLPEDQAVLVVQIAKTQQKMSGGTENFLVTRELNEIASEDQKLQILDCLFAVSAADDEISVAEENVIRRIAAELGFSHREFSEVRSRYNEKRSVLKNLPGSST